MKTQESKKDDLEKFRAWVIRFNMDIKDPDLVRKYLERNKTK